MNDCIFCKIIARQLPAHFIAENSDAIAIKDIAPKAVVHYLVIPKIHVKDLSSLHDKAVWSKMLELVQELSQKHAQEYRIIINNGYNAGQRVFHLHMHFLSGTLPEF